MAYYDKLEMYCRSYNESENYYDAYPKFIDAKRQSADEWMLQNRNLKHVVGGVSIHEIPNDGFDSVVIRNLEIRGEGGRAYKVVATKNGLNFLVDLREKVLMDTIKQFGIEAGGKLLGTYVFISQGSQMNLVLKDGDSFNEALKNNALRNNKVIPKSELKFGHAYRNLSGNTAIFIGTVYDWSGPQFTIRDKPIKKLLFYNTYNLTLDSIQEYVADKTTSLENIYNFNLTESHSYREHLGEVPFYVNLNSNLIFETYRRKAINDLETYYNNYGPGYRSYYGSKRDYTNYNEPFIVTDTINLGSLPQKFIDKLNWLHNKCL